MLNTVNVIELSDCNDPTSTVSFKSFEDNPEGNKLAEALFKETIKRIEPLLHPDDIEGCLEDGNCEALSGNGNGGVYIVHSC